MLHAKSTALWSNHQRKTCCQVARSCKETQSVEIVNINVENTKKRSSEIDVK